MGILFHRDRCDWTRQITPTVDRAKYEVQGCMLQR